MTDDKHTPQRTFGIGAVARMTGLTDHTIRVWERRYEAVVADRARNGRRIYRSDDVEKLRLLRLLTGHGLSIGRIAGESLEELQARAAEMRALSAGQPPAGPLRIAVLSDRLAAVLRTAPARPVALEVVTACTQEDQFLADCRHQAIDALVVETSLADDATPARLRRLADACATDRIVCVYHFARTADLEALMAEGIIALQSPVNATEIAQAVWQTGADDTEPMDQPAVRPAEEPLDGEQEVIPPRRFTPTELATISGLANSIDCECPRHLADLVAALSAFEVYSANCANRNEDDARLHRFLHRTTARARALIEGALERVAREEQLL